MQLAARAPLRWRRGTVQRHAATHAATCFALVVVLCAAGAVNSPPAAAVITAADGRIAYIDHPGRLPSDPYRLMTMQPDGSDKRQLAVPFKLDPTWDTLAWSPDGSRLAVLVGFPTSVYVVRADGTGSVKINPDDGMSTSSVSWSPDSQRIVYDSGGGPSPGVPGIYVAAASGAGTPQRLAGYPYNFGDAVWSPDGAHIVFRLNPDFTGSDDLTELRIMRADGTDNHQLVPPSLMVCAGWVYVLNPPAFSPDGQWIAFSGAPADTSNGCHGRGLYKIRIDGTGLTALTTVTGDDQDADVQWSTSGNTLVFDRADLMKSIGDIYQVSAGGGPVRRLTTDGSADPKWSPSGTRILHFGSDGTGQRGPAIMNADGSQKRVLDTGAVVAIAWQPDTGLAATPPGASRTHVRNDFNRDGRSDFAVFRPANATWYIKGSATTQFGAKTDKPVPADYNGDGRTDLAVYRPATSTFFVRGAATVKLGVSGDQPVPGDYTGDGKADLAVYRPSTSTWLVRGRTAIKFGVRGDRPMAADFNGDGKTDLAVWTPSSGTWRVRGMTPVSFGRSGDVPLAADFNGDGKAEFAVWRPSTATWYVRGLPGVRLGRPGDLPVIGDFNGDGRTDLAVWRPTTGGWYVRGGTGATLGRLGDMPL